MTTHPSTIPGIVPDSPSEGKSIGISDSIEQVTEKVLIDHPDQEADADIEENIFYDGETEVNRFETAATQTIEIASGCDDQELSCPKYRSVGVQTETTMDDLEKAEISLTDLYFKDDEQASFYTGLPNLKALLAVFKVIAPYLQLSHDISLPISRQLALTLMKLRLNLDFQDLGYMFEVPSTIASHTFYNCIEVLCNRIKENIFWPQRHIVQSTMPLCFKESFDNAVTVIIDSFEITAESGGNLKANSKNNQTLKFLIVITPQGSICFLSKPFGSRTTLKNMILQSGFLDNLEAGDLVMSDRSFAVSGAVQSCIAKVVTPTITKGLQQLSPTEVEAYGKIANIRAHVERVIGFTRQKYLILTSRMPIEAISKHSSDSKMTMDQIVTVCCALSNLCDLPVPK